MFNKKSKASKTVQRPSLLVGLKIISRVGEPVDESVIWQALIDAFSKHPTLDVHQAVTAPDLEGKTIGSLDD